MWIKAFIEDSYNTLKALTIYQLPPTTSIHQFSPVLRGAKFSQETISTVYQLNRYLYHPKKSNCYLSYHFSVTSYRNLVFIQEIKPTNNITDFSNLGC